MVLVMIYPWEKGENSQLDNFQCSLVHMKEAELADKELVLDGNFLLLEAQQYSLVSILQSN